VTIEIMRAGRTDSPLKPLRRHTRFGELRHEFSKFRSMSGHELRTVIKRCVPDSSGSESTPHAASLVNNDNVALRLQLMGGSKTSHSRTNDDDVWSTHDDFLAIAQP